MPRKDPLQAQRDLMRRIKTEGPEAAFDALMAVCKDPKTPAPARATAGAALIRAGGLFDKDAQKGHDKPPEEMTAEELAATLAELRARREALMSGAQDAVMNNHDEDEGDDTDEDDSPADGDEPKDMFG